MTRLHGGLPCWLALAVALPVTVVGGRIGFGILIAGALAGWSRQAGGADACGLPRHGGAARAAAVAAVSRNPCGRHLEFHRARETQPGDCVPALVRTREHCGGRFAECPDPAVFQSWLARTFGELHDFSG